MEDEEQGGDVGEHRTPCCAWKGDGGSPPDDRRRDGLRASWPVDADVAQGENDGEQCCVFVGSAEIFVVVGGWTGSISHVLFSVPARDEPSLADIGLVPDVAITTAACPDDTEATTADPASVVAASLAFSAAVAAAVAGAMAWAAATGVVEMDNAADIVGVVAGGAVGAEKQGEWELGASSQHSPECIISACFVQHAVVLLTSAWGDGAVLQDRVESYLEKRERTVPGGIRS